MLASRPKDSLDQKTQETYKKTSFLRGTFKCKSCIYGTIDFKGKSTCLVMGFYGTSYEVDENYVRLKTDKGDLILKIVDKKTLEGEGWATGTYHKVN